MANVGNGIILTWPASGLNVTATAVSTSLAGGILDSYSNTINQVTATAVATPTPGTTVNVLNPSVTDKFKSR